MTFRPSPGIYDRLPDPDRRRVLCNRIIDLLSGPAGSTHKLHLENRKLVPDPKPLLLEITPSHYAGSGMPRPRTSMVVSSLFTESPREPQLVQELLEEMRSAADPAPCQSLAFPAGVRVFHGLHRVGQHVPCRHDQRAGMEPQGDLPGLRPYPGKVFR